MYANVINDKFNCLLFNEVPLTLSPINSQPKGIIIFYDSLFSASRRREFLLNKKRSFYACVSENAPSCHQDIRVLTFSCFFDIPYYFDEMHNIDIFLINGNTSNSCY